MANHLNLRTVERKAHHGFFIKSSYVKALEVDKQDIETFAELQNTPYPEELKELNGIRRSKRNFKG